MKSFFQKKFTAVALLVIAGSAVLKAAEADATAPPSPGGRQFDDFKIITQRNIFDTTRRPPSEQRPPTPRAETPPPPRAEEFTLTGTLVYDEGAVAFFNGRDAQFRKALKPNDSIGGLRIREIRQNQVLLEQDGSELQVSIGTRLVRRGEENWTVTAPSDSESDRAGRTASRREPEPDPELDDILQQLMEKRNQEQNR